MKVLEIMIQDAMDVLKAKDIKLNAMDENFEPFNHLLSAEENKQCWEYLAKQFVANMIRMTAAQNSLDLYKKIVYDDRFYDTWLYFLQSVEGVVRYGHKTPGIENIINSSGISRETFVMFLD